MNSELEKIIIETSVATASMMEVSRMNELAQKRAEELVDKLSELKQKLIKIGGDDTKQKQLSEPFPGPINKHRALAQRINSFLTESGHASVFDDFVGRINSLEKFFVELEEQKLLEISQYMITD